MDKVVIMGTEISLEKKVNSGITQQQKKLSGQGLRFKQESRTTEY